MLQFGVVPSVGRSVSMLQFGVVSVGRSVSMLQFGSLSWS